MNDRVEEQQEQKNIQPGKEKETNECERPCKRMRSEEQLLPAVVHCYRAFNVHNFNSVDFKFFSNGMLSADNGVMHGQWRLERQNIRITWQKIGVEACAHQYLYVNIAENLWAYKAEVADCNSVMVRL